MDTVRFYFSFRSPYAWLAFHKTEPALSELPVELDYIPVFPPPDFPNDPTAVPAKFEYMIRHDIPRLAAAYDLPLRQPVELDVDWIRPHAMWAYAADQDKGLAFGKQVFAARFSRGQSLADDAVYAAIAREVDLDPEQTLRAADDEAYQSRVMQGMAQSAKEGVFGVPFYVYRGELFWGHDRLAWLVRSVCRANSLPAPPPESLT